MVSVGGDVEKKEPLYTVGGNLEEYNHIREIVWRFKNLKNRTVTI